MALSSAGDVIPIVMPQPDQTVEECTLARWRVRAGDRIEKGQVIFEAETSKAVFEVEAEHSGRLARIVVEEDQTVPVMTPVGYMAESDAILDAWLATNAPGRAAEQRPEEQPAALPSALPPADASHAPAAPTPPPHAVARTDGRELRASPAARRLAHEHGIELGTLEGSGPEGRIMIADVEKAIAATAETASAQSAGSEKPVRRPMSLMRQAVARVVAASNQTIPHFYVKATVEAKAALDFRESHKSRQDCSLTDLIVMACARAIQEWPDFRSRLDGNEIVTHPSANIAILVAIEDGLVAPVVRGADRLSFEQLARETRRVVAAARQGKVEGLGEAVFTISNLGMYGVEEFTAIIHPPESAVLAVGAVRDVAIVRDGTICLSKAFTVTLSCDHRLIDGVSAARFLGRVTELVENPGRLS